MVDEGTFGAGDSLLLQGSADRGCGRDELGTIGQSQRAGGIGDEEKPVSTPRNISGKATVTWHIEGYV